jgi:hypothetical protein
MKKLILGILISLLFSSCYEGNYTFSVKITGNQQTYIVSYFDNKGMWNEQVTVQNGFTIYNEYNDNWKLDLIAIGDSVHVSVFKRYSLIKEFSGRDTLELHETIKY